MAIGGEEKGVFGRARAVRAKGAFHGHEEHESCTVLLPCCRIDHKDEEACRKIFAVAIFGHYDKSNYFSPAGAV
ncbi:hypothetical protein [Nocardiopsis ansamitocini]|uniref:hypothetical protein n=1 Tax=Nocardiopsis ansamitocini TaxID=1670832 RepID=UPI0025530D2E|nr:hypothetical protein [Nocardiopsis ansamitocini]